MESLAIWNVYDSLLMSILLVVINGKALESLERGSSDQGYAASLKFQVAVGVRR